MKPLRPSGKGWVGKPFLVPNPLLSKSARGWEHPATGTLVISSVDPSGANGQLEYHLSVSLYSRRCTTDEAMAVLAIFGMDNAQEDDAGYINEVRHFWQPVTKEAA